MERNRVPDSSPSLGSQLPLILRVFVLYDLGCVFCFSPKVQGLKHRSQQGKKRTAPRRTREAQGCENPIVDTFSQFWTPHCENCFNSYPKHSWTNWATNTIIPDQRRAPRDHQLEVAQVRPGYMVPRPNLWSQTPLPKGTEHLPPPPPPKEGNLNEPNLWNRTPPHPRKI